MFTLADWSTYMVVSSPPATEETGAFGRQIEFRQVVAFIKKRDCYVCTYVCTLNHQVLTHILVSCLISPGYRVVIGIGI
jgi:hypothetical protein